MNLTLQAPTLKDCRIVRLWRNDCLETLRTPYPLTEEQQEEFYRNVICNRSSNHRYWSIYENDFLVGFGGLTYIEMENRQAEISLIINPELRGKGYGEKAVPLILDQAFNYLNLELVYGECYFSNERGVDFWKEYIKRHNGMYTVIRKGKYWNGQHYGTMYFDIDKQEYKYNDEKNQ